MKVDRRMKSVGPRGPKAWRVPTVAVIALVIAMAGCGNCLTVTTVNIGQKTSLERQLIGDFEPLTEEEMLAASVRSQGGVGAGSLDDLRQRAISARQRQLFNRDDVQELLGQACLGETSAARLAARKCGAQSAADVAARVARLVSEENQDRDAIIEWAIAIDPVLTPADRAQVVAVYARLLQEQLQTGHWYESSEKGWTQK